VTHSFVTTMTTDSEHSPHPTFTIMDVIRFHQANIAGQNFLADLETAEAMIGSHLRTSEATPRAFAELYDRVRHSEHGLNPFETSALRRRCIRAIVNSGLVRGVLQHKVGASLRTPAWQQFWKATRSPSERNALGRFVGFCCHNGLEPQAVNDDVVRKFMETLRETSSDKFLHRLPRQLARSWNRVAERLHR
jgi:hypothetical protein